MLEFTILELLFGGSPWEAIEVIACAVFFANLVTVCMPNHSDNKYIQFLIDSLNTLSLNILKNANRLCPSRFPDPTKSGQKRHGAGKKLLTNA